MCQKTNENLRKLGAILNRDGKNAAYWDAPLIIRMSDCSGSLLYEILSTENGGWVQDKDRFLSNGCSCTMSQGQAGGGGTYRRFYLCLSHDRVLFKMPSQAMISARKPAVQALKQKEMPKQKRNKGRKVHHFEPEEYPLIGWHEGVRVVPGGLPGLGKHR